MTSDFLAGAGGRAGLYTRKRPARGKAGRAGKSRGRSPAPPGAPGPACPRLTTPPQPSGRGDPTAAASLSPVPSLRAPARLPSSSPTPRKSPGGRLPRGAARRPATRRPPPAGRPEGSGGEGVAEPCPALSPAPRLPSPRQARRTPGTSTWGLRHQRQAAPPAPRHFQRRRCPSRGRGSGRLSRGGSLGWPEMGRPGWGCRGGVVRGCCSHKTPAQAPLLRVGGYSTPRVMLACHDSVVSSSSVPLPKH